MKPLAFFVGRRSRAATIEDVAKQTPLDGRTIKGLKTLSMRAQLRRAAATARPIRPRISSSARGTATTSWSATSVRCTRSGRGKEGLFEGQHGPVLRLARCEEVPARRAGGRGHRGGVPQPHGRATCTPAGVGGRQAAQHGLAASGVLRAPADLPTRGLGTMFPRNLEDSGLKWLRLEPYRECAAVVERHRDGIAACCDPASNVSLSLFDGPNNKVRVLQRRVCRLRDRECLRAKVLTCTLPQICPRSRATGPGVHRHAAPPP